MKKNIFFVIFALILSVSLAIAVNAARPTADMTKKDGISAEMNITSDVAASESISLSVKLSNGGEAQISNVSVEVTVPEDLRITSGESITSADLSAGKAVELLYGITHISAIPQTEEQQVTGEAEEKGCGAVISVSAALFVLICAVFFVIKYPKRGMAMLLACLMLVPAIAVGTGAATTSRKLELSAWAQYAGEEYEIGVTVTYDHTFTEAKGTDTKGMEKFEITYY